MSFQRHREMKLRIDKAADEKFGVTLQAQNLKLHGMHESVKQATLADFLVEDNYVQKRQRMHVPHLGEIHKTQSLGFRIEGRIGHALTVQLDQPYSIQEFCREIRPHEGFLVLAESSCRLKIGFALIAQICGNQFDRLADALVG